MAKCKFVINLRWGIFGVFLFCCCFRGLRSSPRYWETREHHLLTPCSIWPQNARTSLLRLRCFAHAGDRFQHGWMFTFFLYFNHIKSIIGENSFQFPLRLLYVLCGTRIATVTWRPVPAFHRPAERFGYRGNSIFYLGDCIVCCCCKWSQAKKRSRLCLMVVDMLLSTCQWCVYLAQVVAGAQGEIKCVEVVRELKMNCNSKCSIISFDPTGSKHNSLKPFLMSQSMWAGGIDLSHLKYYHNICRCWIVW